MRWAHERDIKVKRHSGGVSRSGVSQVAGFAIVQALQLDVVGHIASGPIPMPAEEMTRVVDETDCYLEICSSGNPRMVLHLMEAAHGPRHHHPGGLLLRHGNQWAGSWFDRLTMSGSARIEGTSPLVLSLSEGQPLHFLHGL